MANDRLWLECKKCKERIMLYKYYPSGGYIPLQSVEPVASFICRHALECSGGGFGLGRPEEWLGLVTDLKKYWEDWDGQLVV